MKAELHRVGNDGTAVVVIDEFTGQPERLTDLAAAMAPLPWAKGSLYPGLRRVITKHDSDADAFADQAMRAVAPYVAGAYDCASFKLLEASFSMITAPPGALAPPQRAPHFNSTDPGYLALLLYVGVPWPSGTAFFRHRATGIEVMDDANVDRFVATAKAEAAQPDAASGYILGGNRWYEQIGDVEAVPDRLVIYPGSLLHSGIVPANAPLDADPRTGRLTVNFFVQLQGSPSQ